MGETVYGVVAVSVVNHGVIYRLVDIFACRCDLYTLQNIDVVEFFGVVLYTLNRYSVPGVRIKPLAKCELHRKEQTDNGDWNIDVKQELAGH